MSFSQESYKLGEKGAVTPSENRFGHVSPATSGAVCLDLNESFKDSDLVLDCGQSSIGLESTIIEYTEDLTRILSLGTITSVVILEDSGLDFVLDDA